MGHSLKQMAKDTFFGITMGVWLIIGGFLLSLTIYGAILGIPMILLGLFFPAIELVLGYKGETWTGEHITCTKCGTRMSSEHADGLCASCHEALESRRDAA